MLHMPSAPNYIIYVMCNATFHYDPYKLITKFNKWTFYRFVNMVHIAKPWNGEGTHTWERHIKLPKNQNTMKGKGSVGNNKKLQYIV